jgi:hypothetical protein
MKQTFISITRHALRSTLLAAAGAVVLMSIPPTAMAGNVHFGVRCQSDFQSGWLPTIDVYGACSDFINEIQPVEYVDFYFNLHGAQPAFYNGQGAETCNPCGGADSVDFFVMSTHGGIANNNANYAGYAMWDDACSGTNPPGCMAWTPNMRFGSAGQQLKVFATFSCDTFKDSDGMFWNRWSSVYSGGLKIGVGGHDLLYTGNDTQALQNFATYMRANDAIGWSWLDSVYYANNSNHPTVANTGANSTDCWNRQGLTLNNVVGATTLRDGQIGYYCWTNWN